MHKQLVIISDMEGASGIFESNKKTLYHGSEEWYNEGRKLMTSDVLAHPQSYLLLLLYHLSIFIN